MREITRETKIYHFTDVIVEYLVREFIELFDSFKSNLLVRDEINILTKVNDLYEKLSTITTNKLLELAQLQFEYITQGDYDLSIIDNAWLMELFENFNPVTKYVYINEIDRKRSRMYEGIMSSDTPVDEVERSLKYWCSMVSQMAVDVTDKATETAYKCCEVSMVEWVSENDSRRCDKCKHLDGQVFSIYEIPPKQHNHCRCFVIPA